MEHLLVDDSLPKPHVHPEMVWFFPAIKVTGPMDFVDECDPYVLHDECTESTSATSLCRDISGARNGALRMLERFADNHPDATPDAVQTALMTYCNLVIGFAFPTQGTTSTPGPHRRKLKSKKKKKAGAPGRVSVDGDETAAAAAATLAADAASKVEAKKRPDALNVDIDTRFIPLRFRWSDLMGPNVVAFLNARAECSEVFLTAGLAALRLTASVYEDDSDAGEKPPAKRDEDLIKRCYKVLLSAAGALELSRSVLNDPSGGTEGQDTPSRSYWDKKCVAPAKYTTLPLDIADGQCATLLLEIALAEAQELTIVRACGANRQSALLLAKLCGDTAARYGRIESLGTTLPSHEHAKSWLGGEKVPPFQAVATAFGAFRCVYYRAMALYFRAVFQRDEAECGQAIANIRAAIAFTEDECLSAGRNYCKASAKAKKSGAPSPLLGARLQARIDADLARLGAAFRTVESECVSRNNMFAHQAIGDAENPVAQTVSMVKPSEWPAVTLDARWEAEGSVLSALDARACPASDEPIEEESLCSVM